MGEGRDRDTGKTRPAVNDNESRVAWISGQGFGWTPNDRDTADLARREMEFAALNQSSKTRKCDKDALHLVLSWRTGETPTREEMEQAAKEALAALGMENARALFVAHNDTKHAHLHIIASRINPETKRTFSDSYSKKKLQAWALEWERAHGNVQCLNREKRSQFADAIEKRDAAAILELMTQRQSTFTEKELDRALRKEANAEVAADLKRQIISRPDIVPLYDRESGKKLDRFTTQTVRQSEHEALERAAALVGNRRHHVSQRAAAAALAKCPTMRDEQRRAFDHATGAEGLAIIDGKAGTGKSYTMDAIRVAYAADGRRVIGLAPTRRVVEKMESDGFTEAKTIHKIIWDLNRGKEHINAQTVLMVDEAAMVGTRLLSELLKHAAAVGAKVILVGDDRQLDSIERGGLFTALREKFGAATLSFVTRQNDAEHKAISEMLSRSEFAEGVEALDKLGCINRSNHQSEAIDALVEQWKKDTAERPEKSRLVFAYTNDLVLDINARLRVVRKERGELGADHEFSTNDGKLLFAKGDRLIFNTTDARKGINNGTVGTITEIDGTQITLSVDGRKRQLTFDAAEVKGFRHGYASTIHKGQGDTTDEAALLHTIHWKDAAAYVALTRHRDNVKVFTSIEVAQDNAELAQQLGRHDERRASIAFDTEAEARQRQQIRTDQLLAAAEAAKQEAAKRAAERHAATPAPEWVEERQRQERRERAEKAAAYQKAEATRAEERQQRQQERRNEAMNRVGKAARDAAAQQQRQQEAKAAAERKAAAETKKARDWAQREQDAEQRKAEAAQHQDARQAISAMVAAARQQRQQAAAVAVEQKAEAARQQQAQEAAKVKEYDRAAAQVTDPARAPHHPPPPDKQPKQEPEATPAPERRPDPVTTRRQTSHATHGEDARRAEQAADRRDDQQKAEAIQPKPEQIAAKAERQETPWQIIRRQQQEQEAAKAKAAPQPVEKKAEAIQQQREQEEQKRQQAAERRQPVAAPQVQPKATPAPTVAPPVQKPAAAPLAQPKAAPEPWRSTTPTVDPRAPATPAQQAERKAEAIQPKPPQSRPLGSPTPPAPQQQPRATPAPTVAPPIQKPAPAPQVQPKATPAPIPAPSVQKPAAAPLAQPKAAPAQPVEKKAEVIQPESEKKPEPEMDERTRRFIEMLERNFTRDDRDRSDRSR
jgi:Ti-type conjugative transfer relaxase TraA